MDDLDVLRGELKRIAADDDFWSTMQRQREALRRHFYPSGKEG